MCIYDSWYAVRPTARTTLIVLATMLVGVWIFDVATPIKRVSRGEFGLPTHVPVPVTWSPDKTHMRWVNPANGVAVSIPAPATLREPCAVTCFVPSNGGIRNVEAQDPHTYWSDWSFDTPLLLHFLGYCVVTPVMTCGVLYVYIRVWMKGLTPERRMGQLVGGFALCLMLTSLGVCALFFVSNTMKPEPALIEVHAQIKGPYSLTTPDQPNIRRNGWTTLEMEVQWQILDTNLTAPAVVRCARKQTDCVDHVHRIIAHRRVTIQIPFNGANAPVYLPYGFVPREQSFVKPRVNPSGISLMFAMLLLVYPCLFLMWTAPTGSE